MHLRLTIVLLLQAVAALLPKHQCSVRYQPSVALFDLLKLVFVPVAASHSSLKSATKPPASMLVGFAVKFIYDCDTRCNVAV